MAARRNHCIIAALSICLLVTSSVANAQYSGGNGTAEIPYRIATAADLIALGNAPYHYDRHFILTADIDLDPNLPGGKVFDRAVIAPDMYPVDDFQGTSFGGTLDGNHHKISNLTINAGTGEYVGLFGVITSAGTVRALTLENIATVGRKYVGSLVGCNEGAIADCQVTCRIRGKGFAPWRIGGLVAFNTGSIDGCVVRGRIDAQNHAGYFGGLTGGNEGSIANSSAHADIVAGANSWDLGGLVGDSRGPITNCHATGSITGGDRCRFLAGLAAVNYQATITNCSSMADVSAGPGSNRLGGLVGGNPNGTITRSYSSGDVTADKGSWGLGGLAGDNYGTVTDCWASSRVASGDGGSSIGGLIGYSGGSVVNCYTSGQVSVERNTKHFGALIGDSKGTVSGCFWNADNSGQTTSAGGEGRTTAEMQTAAIFLGAGWDFVDEMRNGADDIWKIVEGHTYPLLSWQRYGGGTGEPNAPYLLYTAEHLNALGAEPNDYDKHFQLMADIDLSEYTYDRAVIAPDVNDYGYWFQGTPFTGVLDGGDHTISHLTISGKCWLGLFGTLGSEAKISDLGLEAVDVTGTGIGIGGLAGRNSGTITSSYSTGSVIGEDGVGGLAGVNDGKTAYIAACHSSASVSGVSAVGGLAGRNDWGTISASRSTGAAAGTWAIGGLVGACDSGEIIASYSSSPAEGPLGAGGLVGDLDCSFLDNFDPSSVVHCYATGAVSGDDGWVGGLVGVRCLAGPIHGFWDIETSGQTTSDGGEGLTTAQMQTAETFLDAGWDFMGETDNGTDDIWWILEEQGYPRLRWELEDEETDQ